MAASGAGAGGVYFLLPAMLIIVIINSLGPQVDGADHLHHDSLLELPSMPLPAPSDHHRHHQRLVEDAAAAATAGDVQEEEDPEEEEEEEGMVARRSGTRRRSKGEAGELEKRFAESVDSFGAVGDGAADDTLAFRSAWDAVCSTKTTSRSSSAVFLVPEGRRYLVNATTFSGPCSHRNLLIQVRGTVVAPADPNQWDPESPRAWLTFSHLAGAVLRGGGVIDGSGANWWSSSCKINKTNPCRGAPTALTIESSIGVRVRELSIVSAQQMHLTVSRCSAVRVSSIRIRSPKESPNTDGIHVSESTGVTIQNCQIATGDDCISIVNGSSNIKMKNIECGPGHGISIGSLGKDNSVAEVTGIVLDTATLTNTSNGIRIKTWQGGYGQVRALRFENVKMNNVAYPIIIDQFYCDSPTICKNQTSAVKVSEVVYEKISGTSSTAEAMRFACSDTVPCTGIVLADVDLQTTGDGAAAARTFCNCAAGAGVGSVAPPADCLIDGDATDNCGGAIDDVDRVIMHDEL